MYSPKRKSINYHDVQVSGEFLRPAHVPVLSYAPF